MEDGVRYCRGNADDTDLAHALYADRIDYVIVLVNEDDLNVLNVRVDRHVIFGEIVIHYSPVIMIDNGFFLESHPNPPDNSA